jgi:hypothetical protein
LGGGGGADETACGLNDGWLLMAEMALISTAPDRGRRDYYKQSLRQH